MIYHHALIAAIAATLAACAPPMLDTSGRSSFTPSAPPIVVPHSQGGLFHIYENNRKRLARHNGVVNLCAGGQSAHTIFISLPNACTCPDAPWDFHGPADIFGNPLPRARNRELARYYLPTTRRWFQDVASWKYGRDFETLTGLDLHRMDGVRLCQSAGAV